MSGTILLSVGRLLGYPECCIREFVSRNPSQGDPVLSTYKTEGRISWYVNVSLLSFDWALITHVPCSPRCERSLELAYGAYRVLFEGSLQLAQQMTLALATHVLHTEYFGVLAFRGSPEPHGWRIGSILLAQPGSVLEKVVCSGDCLTLDNEGVCIGNMFIEDRSARVLWFC